MTKTTDAQACFDIVSQMLGKHVGEENGFIAADEKDIVKNAERAGLRARIKRINLEKTDFINSPLIAKDNKGIFFVIAKVNADKVLLFYPGANETHIKSKKEMKDIWDGTVIVINKKAKERTDGKFGFRWFIPTVIKHKTEFVQVLVAAFMLQIFGILTPLMTQVVVDKVLTHNSLSTLNVLTIGILIIYAYDLIVGIAKNYVFTHTTNRIDVMLSVKLFRHLFSLPLRYFESRRVGDTVARVRELDTIRSFLTGTPLSSLIDLCFMVVYIIVLFLYSPKLTVIVLCSIPVYAVLSAVITPLFKKRLDERFNAGADTQSFMVESINGIQTVKSFALENDFEDKYGELQAEYVKASYKTQMLSANAGTIGKFIEEVFDLLILFFGAKAVMDGSFTIGELVAFRMLAGRVSGPVLRLVQLWQEYQQASLSVARIGDIFNTFPEPSSGTDTLSVPKINGNISFDKVRFRYTADGNTVINDMSFDIPGGQITGLVGRSGSGKSTVSKLIQRLYIPEGGKITIDGMDISLVDPQLLRHHIGVVLQENFMFSGTVSENISIHMKNASFEKIVEAAETAGAHDFIMKLPFGYDTVIGERGISLSGGQKQRIAIARAIISDPEILIFDEATSALDYESESIIQNNLKDICRDRTVLIIAHRLSTLKDARKIMVIDDGKLMEYDTHEKLIKKRNGIYHALYNIQKEGKTE